MLGFSNDLLKCLIDLKWYGEYIIPSNKYNWEYMGVAFIYLKDYIYAELNVVIPK